MTIQELAENATEAANKLRALVEKHPDWTAERNDVGNVAFEDSEGRYVGYVRFHWGEVRTSDDENWFT